MSGLQTFSCCAFLDFASELPKAEHLPEVVQINWARVDEPMRGTNILEKSKERIWLLTKVFVTSGSVKAAVPERVALALFPCASKEEFIQAHDAGQVQFPLFHNVRLSRTSKTFAMPSTAE